MTRPRSCPRIEHISERDVPDSQRTPSPDCVNEQDEDEDEVEDDIGSALDTTSASSEEDDPSFCLSERTKVNIKPRKQPIAFNQPVVDVYYEGSMDRATLESRVSQPVQLDGVSLTPHQLTMVKRVVEALEKTYKIHTIRSEPGAGKTICAYAIAKMLGLKLVVVHPVRVTSWKEESERCGFPLELELGYEALRSVRGQKEPKHGLLTRVDRPAVVVSKKRKRSDSSSEESSRSSCSSDSGSSESQSVSHSKSTRSKQKLKHPPPQFYPTSKWTGLLQQGILLVLDESHRAKNKSERTLALTALVNAVVDTPGHRSRCLYLSATQFDQPVHVEAVCKSMGLIGQGNDLSQSRLVQLGRIFEPEHRLVQPKLVEQVCRSTRRDRLKYIYRVFIHILSPRLSSSTPKLKIPVNMDVRIGFYRMPREDELEIRRSMLQWRRATETPGKFPERLALMSRAVHQTQIAKVRTVVRLVHTVFRENPNVSVVVMGESIRALDSIAMELRAKFHWTPEEAREDTFVPAIHVLTSRMSLSRQQKVIEEFQNGTCSILVANLEVGGEGLNLQDKVGDRDRWVFMLPSSHATSMFQGFFRFYRWDTKSDVNVRLVMCRSKNKNGVDVHRESALLKNHKKKDRVWRDLMPEQDQAGAQFLAGLEMFYESE